MKLFGLNNTQDKRHLLICSYYQPHVSDEISLENFEISLGRADSGKARLVVAGDLNFPDWDWSTKQLKRPCQYPTLHNRLIDIINDHRMEQVVEYPTREDNTLDLVITNTPNIIPRVELLPGIFDHDIVYFEYKSKVVLNNNRSRSIPL